MNFNFLDIYVKAFIELKVCTSCHRALHLCEFSYASGGNYKRSKCRTCEKAQVKIRKELKSQNPAPVDPDYKCLICHRNAEECASEGNKNNGPWVLDHDSKTGKFRGYICHTCNRGLGCFKDDLFILDNAIQYIKLHKD